MHRAVTVLLQSPAAMIYISAICFHTFFRAVYKKLIITFSIAHAGLLMSIIVILLIRIYLAFKESIWSE